ncbi:MAG: CPBP family intramembrane metalloprotease [Myxococcales bacterium]|nr:CPBP family intramembrane metalloprotease [Myxococcales bacterium]
MSARAIPARTGSAPRERGAAGFASKPGAWVDLALTLPVFLAYQLGVVFLKVQNATDVVTSRLLALTHGDRVEYLALTSGIGVALLLVFALLGRGQPLRLRKVLQIALEGAVYAAAMGTATSWVVGHLFAGPTGAAVHDPFTGLVMSFGAGFYEELAFRVLLFGLGAKILVRLFTGERLSLVRGGTPIGVRSLLVMAIWAIVAAAAFSGMHYLGPLGDPFDARSFVARAVLGLALTLVYACRGFAAAVWTHALYDAWVIVL